MIIEWQGIGIISLILVACMLVITLLEKILKLKPETRRKGFHMAMGLSMLALPYLFKNVWSAVVLAAIAFVFLYIIRKLKDKTPFGTVLYGVKRKSLGEFFYIIAVLLVFYLSKGDKILYSIPILILTFADSTAALIGKIYGKKQLAEGTEDKKSLEGSFAFFCVAFMATLVPLLLFTEVARENVLHISLIVGFIIALIEMISSNGSDNLLIPLSAFAFVRHLMVLTTEELRINLLIVFALIVIVFIISKVKVFSKMAIAEAIVVGYLTIILYGWYALIPPLLLLLTVMTFPLPNVKERHNKYDVKIVETNVILGLAICLIVSIIGQKEQIYMTYVTTYAMHLAINSYVRFKFERGCPCIKSGVFAFTKGLVFVFVPGLLIQRFALSYALDWKILILMVACLLGSVLAIAYSKRNEETEEISVKNGYLHLKIAAIFVGILGIVQFLESGIIFYGI